MCFVFYLHKYLFTIIMFIILQIKYINNDNLEKIITVINIKKYFKDIGLNIEKLKQ